MFIEIYLLEGCERESYDGRFWGVSTWKRNFYNFFDLNFNFLIFFLIFYSQVDKPQKIHQYFIIIYLANYISTKNLLRKNSFQLQAGSNITVVYRGGESEYRKYQYALQ
jgi:hypothetical protein